MEFKTDRVKKWASMVAIVGIVFSLLEGAYFGFWLSLGFLTFIVVSIIGMIIPVCLYFILHILADAIEKNTRVIAEMRDAAKRVPGVAYEGEWKCPSCGKINKDYTTTCSCGTAKED